MNQTLSYILSGALTAAAAYLLGSICFAIPVARIFIKKDIRTVGSKNAGMTNVLRCAGIPAAVITAAGDLAKGAAAVYIGRAVFAALAGGGQLYGGYIGGIFAVLGHALPLWFKFRGGKGVLAAAGMLLALDPQVFGLCFAVFLIFFLVSRIVSASSLAASAALPVVTWVLGGLRGDRDLIFKGCAALLIAAAVFVLHRANIIRIFKGEEKPLSIGGKKKPGGQDAPPDADA